MTIEKQVEALDWQLEKTSHPYPYYRAKQGNFSTLWRNSPEEVLSDIRKIYESRKTCAKPF